MLPGVAALLFFALDLAPLEAAIARGEFQKIGSVLVAQHGKLVYEKYFEGGPETLRDTRSVTKTITGALIGIAVKQKKLSLDTPVFSLFPGKSKGKESITVQDLLTMSSALDCNDWEDNSPGNEEKMYPRKDWAQFVFDLPLRSARTFSYCTGGVFLLGQALEKAAGLRADRYAEMELFAPLGIKETQWVYSPAGEPQTGGGLRLRSRDLLRFAQLYLDAGGGVLDAPWVRASTQPHARIDEQTQYGYLWWLKSFAGKPAFFMTGNGGNKVVVFPAQEMVVVITSTNFSTRGMHQATERVLTEYVLPGAQAR